MFKIEHFLYENNRFKIAWGEWMGEPAMAMRWESEGGGKGFPLSHSNPVWLVIENELNIGILASLIGKNGAKTGNILTVIQQELP